MKTEFFCLLNLLLTARLLTLFDDKILSLRKSFTTSVVLTIIFLICFQFSSYVIYSIALITILGLLQSEAERSTGSLAMIRTVSMILLICALSLVSVSNLQFRGFIADGLNSWLNNQPLFSVGTGFSALKANLLLFGVLFIMNEVNFPIRFILKLTGVTQKMEVSDKSKDEPVGTLNAGRVIGILERFLILIFVLLNQFSAIGFILAAKGLTRFKEMEKRPFAEYVLIGTLLSTALAIIVSFAIKRLLQIS